MRDAAWFSQWPKNHNAVRSGIDKRCAKETQMNQFQEIFDKQKAYFDSDATKSYDGASIS